jgi:hypothetical protein
MIPSGRRKPRESLSDVGLCVVAMRKAAFTILGALLIAGLAVQPATASEHHMRAARGHHHWDYRGSYNQLNEPSYTPGQPLNGGITTP